MALRIVARRVEKGPVDVLLDSAQGPLVGQAGTLQYLYISLSNRCNARCAYCDVHDEPPPHVPVQAADLHRLLSQARALGCRTVHFMGGGEPLIDPSFSWAIEACAAHDVAVVITTNGSHLASRIERDLHRVRLEGLAVSLDSHDPAIHDAVRGVPDLWARARAGIDASRALDPAPWVVLNHVLTRHNIDGPALEGFVRFAGEIGARAINPIPVKDRPGLSASATQAAALARALPGLRGLAAEHDVEWLCGDAEVQAWADAHHTGHFDCTFPQHALYLDLPSGGVFPCDCTVHRRPRELFELGDLWTQSLAEIWRGAPIERLRRRLCSPSDPGCKGDCDWNNIRTNARLRVIHE